MDDWEYDDPLAATGGLVVRGVHERDAFQLSLLGELDIATCSVLERKLQMTEGVHAGRLVLDLGGLDFLDSAGLHTLLRAQDHWRARGRAITLLRGPRAVQRVFELTDAERLFTFED